MQSEQPDNSPFGFLHAQQADGLENRPKLPYHEMKGADWVGVVFLLADHVLLTPLVEITEILPVGALTPVPGVKPWLRGVTISRGELFAVTDLSGFLTQKIATITTYSRILVVSYLEEYSGLMVDRVLGLQHIPEENRKASLSKTMANKKYEPYIIGAYFNEKMELPIMSCKTIVQNPRFRDVVLKDDEIPELEKNNGF